MESILPKKGQMSLEMIIGLVILLVVAAVVINIFITKVGVDKLPGTPEKQLSIKNFKSKCDKLCKQYQNEGNLKYCKTRYGGEDWNLNDKKNELISVGPAAGWKVCEDSVYCFHVVPCSWGTGELTMNDCRALLCQAYSEKYNGNLTMASKALKDDIKISKDPICNQKLNQLPTMESWYKSRFASKGFCGTGGGTPMTTTTTGGGGGPTLACMKKGSSSIKCTWSNCASGTQRILAAQKNVKTFVNSKQGSHEFTGLKSNVDYSFALICNNGKQVTSSPINL